MPNWYIEGYNKKFLFRKGVKYTEKVMDSTKTSISVMFAGSAAAPESYFRLYVVYKAENLEELVPEWTN